MEINNVKFSSVLLQDFAIKQLVSSHSKGRVAQSYLFVGEESIGKSKVAFSFAAFLQCLNSNSQNYVEACGSCDSCRRISNGSHPDVEQVSPIGNEIRIDQVREMQSQALLKPNMGNWRIFILNPADRLNLSSANSLLKILEEAPSHVIFILLSKDTGSVIPTVLSRCEVVRFQTPSYQDSRQALRDRFNFDMGTAAQVFSLADGRLGQALTLCENFEKIEMLRGLRKSHTRFLNDIEAYSEDLQETLEKADDLEAAVKSMSEVLSSSYFPLKISRKAFCRSYILQSAVPAAFPLLFTDSFLERIEVSRKKMKKHFDAIVAESKASYQSGILKEAESVFSACINSWVHNQIIDLFSCFESFYEDAIRWSCCQDETLLLNLDQKEDIITLSKVEDIVLLNRRISLLNESVGLLKRYIQPSFIIENVLTQIGGLAA